MTVAGSQTSSNPGWRGRDWTIWLMITSLLLVTLFLDTDGLDSRVTTERFTLDGRTYEGRLFSPDGTMKEVVLAAHGTNSHREIFMPLAWECANRGISLFTFDSPTVTTDEGVGIRSRELEAALAALRASQW